MTHVLSPLAVFVPIGAGNDAEQDRYVLRPLSGNCSQTAGGRHCTLRDGRPLL